MLFNHEDLPLMPTPPVEQPRTRMRRKRMRKPQQLSLLDLLILPTHASRELG